MIDALHYMIGIINKPGPVRDELNKEFSWIDPSKRLILVTGHRRESFGQDFLHICEALREITKRDCVQIV